MSQDKEYQALARRFVDLWQERMSAMMQDGECVRLLLTMVHGMPFSANATTASGETASSESIVHDFTSYKPRSGRAPHTSDARGAALAGIDERLAAIERSIAELAKDHKPTKKPRRVQRTVAKTTARSDAQDRRRIRGKK